MIQIWKFLTNGEKINDFFARCDQSIKIDTVLSINKSVEIVRMELIDVDCIDQSVESIEC